MGTNLRSCGRLGSGTRGSSSTIVSRRRGGVEDVVCCALRQPPSASPDHACPCAAVSAHGVPSRETAVGHRNKSLTYGEVTPASIHGDVLPALTIRADALLAGRPSSGSTATAVVHSYSGGSTGGGGGGRAAPPIAGTLARATSMGSDASGSGSGSDTDGASAKGRRVAAPSPAGRSSLQSSPARSMGSGASPRSGSGGSRGSRGVVPWSLAQFADPSVDMTDMATLLHDDVFYDLGSGTGKIPLQVVLQTGVARAVGVEFAKSRHQLAHDAYAVMRERPAAELQAGIARLVAAGAALPAGWTPATVASRLKDASTRVEAVCANFLTTDLSDATVVFVNNTVFEPCLMIPLLEVLAALPRVRVVMTLRPLCSRHSARCEIRGEPCAAFAHPPIEGTCKVRRMLGGVSMKPTIRATYPRWSASVAVVEAR